MTQPRESAPLWVGLTFALMIVGTVVYLAGYFMVEDILAWFK
jgi:type IV secretory pathway VirB3-like protein